MKWGGRLAGVLLIAAWILAGPAATSAVAQAGPGGNLEYAVKANYLVRFAAFVDWPESAFGAPEAPLVICVVGHDPFGPALEQAAAAQTAHGRRLAIRRPASPAALTGCHIAYVGVGATAAWSDRLDGQAAVLVVTDQAAGPHGGTIQFVLVNNRVRFRIDQGAAARSGLVISSRLLNLAVSVEGRG